MKNGRDSLKGREPDCNPGGPQPSRFDPRHVQRAGSKPAHVAGAWRPRGTRGAGWLPASGTFESRCELSLKDVPSLLTDDQVQRLIMNVCSTSPKTKEEMAEIIAWANETLINKGLLDAALAGEIALDWDRDEQDIVFKGGDADRARAREAVGVVR